MDRIDSIANFAVIIISIFVLFKLGISHIDLLYAVKIAVIVMLMNMTLAFVRYSAELAEKGILNLPKLIEMTLVNGLKQFFIAVQWWILLGFIASNILKLIK